MKRIFLISFSIFLSFTSYAQTKTSVKEYISQYKDIAIANMNTYGIPASIIMAQAISESGSGNSQLALKSNNHFGIKCKPEWTGERVSHDDDALGECFRKYSTVYDSYMDHSAFLTTRDRYSSLFELEVTDYQGWAQGLKSAGYATNPQYPTMLIRIIEANKLHELDDAALLIAQGVVEEVVEPTQVAVKVEEPVTLDENSYVGFIASARDYNIKATRLQIPVYINNNVEFIIAQKGDTFNSISVRTKKSVNRLVKYNELETAPEGVAEGSIIYISTKKSKVANGFNYHTVAKKETLHSISQKYGVRIDKLAKLNLYTRSYKVKPGQKMLLK